MQTGSDQIRHAAQHPRIAARLTEAFRAIDAECTSIRQLSVGGQGALFLLRMKTGDDVVVKVPAYAGRTAQEAAAAESTLRREEMILGALRCDAVPRLVAKSLDGGFLAREYVPGIALSDILHGATSASRRVKLVRSLLEAAVQLFPRFHESPRGAFVMRDFKPANLVVDDRTGRTVFVDVGSVRSEKDMVARTPAPYRLGSGKWVHWAPEQIMECRNILDRRADFFSLGSSIFTVATGRPPYTNLIHPPQEAWDEYARTHAAISEEALASSALQAAGPGVPQFVAAALAPDPHLRPPHLPPVWQDATPRAAAAPFA
ncbi:MAG: hypothetical protein V4510_05705 [bacterium]